MLPSNLPKISPQAELRPPASRVRRAPTIGARVWAIARRNLGLRIISILLAIALWLFVNAGEHGSIQSYSVPISYHHLPPHLVITNPHPETVRVVLSGPRTLLSIIQPSRLTVRLDLSGVGIGQASFRIEPDSFSNLPRTTTVTSIAPSQIVLDIDRIVSVDLPVHVVTSGSPAPGYRMVGLAADPLKVRVRGPSRVLARFDDVDTDPVNLSGLNNNLTETVAIPTPAPGVRIESPAVTVTATIAPIIKEKEFRAVPVQVRNSVNVTRTWPARVSLVLRGPQLTLDHLDLAKAAYVDADGLGPGYYDASLELDLPDGVELVHETPGRVKLRIYRSKASGQVG